MRAQSSSEHSHSNLSSTVLSTGPQTTVPPAVIVVLQLSCLFEQVLLQGTCISSALVLMPIVHYRPAASDSQLTVQLILSKLVAQS